MGKKKFVDWCLSFAGCDGGDIGSENSPAIWVCGIEWGGGHTPQSLKENMDYDLSNPPEGYDEWEANLAYPYNRQVMKLLAAIDGVQVDDYEKFAKEKKPFVEGSKGYFKMNLYPIGFKDTDESRWKEEFEEITGFKNKSEYISWCKENRLPNIRKWASKYKPKLVVCLGKSYVDDFKKAFLDENSELTREQIDDRELMWSVNKDGTLVVITPFVLNRYGLNKNSTIQKFGARIRELLESQNS